MRPPWTLICGTSAFRAGSLSAAYRVCTVPWIGWTKPKSKFETVRFSTSLSGVSSFVTETEIERQPAADAPVVVGVEAPGRGVLVVLPRRA